MESRIDALGDHKEVKDVVPPEILVVLNLAAKVRPEEEEAPEKSCDTDNDSNTLWDTKAGRFEIRLGCALKNEVIDLDCQSDTKITGNSNQTAAERVVVL